MFEIFDLYHNISYQIIVSIYSAVIALCVEVEANNEYSGQGMEPPLGLGQVGRHLLKYLKLYQNTSY